MLSALLLVFAAPPAQEADVQRVPSQIDRVTVYAAQSLVERSATVEANAPGSHTVVLGPFPLSAATESFQVRIVDGPAVIQGLEVRSEAGYALDTFDRERLRAELDDLQRRRRLLDSDLASIHAGEDFVDSLLRSLGNGEKAAEVLNASPENGLKPLFEFVRDRSFELDQAKASYENSSRRLDLLIGDAQSKLNDEEGGLPRRYLMARVSLFFQRPQSARLQMDYLVPNAAWRPTYDVRVAPDLTGVTVGLVAQVVQQTGEDWSNAQILLSTSMPHVGLNPPDVPRRIYETPRLSRSFGTLGAEEIDGLAEAGLAREGDLGFLPAPEVQVIGFGITTQFLLPERKTVRSDGEAHRFLIREVPLSVRPERYVVPSRSDRAHLRADVTLVGDAPMLAGPAKVFLGPDYLGEASMPTLRPGEATQINLGVDPNLKVEWETITDERDDPGFLASTVQITRVYRCRVSLGASAPGPVNVLIEDSIPVSRDDRIEVTPTQVQPQPEDDAPSRELRTEKGTYRWRFRLSPGQSESTRWGYIVSFDEEFSPVLTED